MGAHHLFGPLSRRRFDPIKQAYDPDRPDGRLNITASALTNWVSIPAVLVAGATTTQNSRFSSLAVAVTIANTHCAYPRRDGQAELAWVAGYVVRQFTCSKAVTNPTTIYSRAQYRATTLIQTTRYVTATLNRHLDSMENT